MAGTFWFKFYMNDYFGDTRPLSLAARGLLVELIMHLRKTDGEMEVNLEFISRLTGGLTKEITEIFAEFRQFGIFSFENRDGKEFLISRKIKKEFHKSLIAKSNGKKGGNPALILDNQKDNQADNLNPDFEFKSDFINEKGGVGEKTRHTEIEIHLSTMNPQAAALAKVWIVAKKDPDWLWDQCKAAWAKKKIHVNELTERTLFDNLRDFRPLAAAWLVEASKTGQILQNPKNYLRPQDGVYGFQNTIRPMDSKTGPDTSGPPPPPTTKTYNR